jgi:uncharacterized protein YoxC
MSILDLAAVIVALAFAALVGFLVPVLLAARKAMAEVERSILRINTELLPLLAEMRATMANLNDLVDKTRASVDQAAGVFRAVGEVGESVRRVHDLICGTGGFLLRRVVNVAAAGLQAIATVFRRQSNTQHNGG